jgi:hypothetical protein
MNLKKLIACWLFIPCLLVLAGCVSVSPGETANADFGVCPSSYQDDIKNLMSNTLKDPYSAVYTFSTPRKGVGQDGLLRGGKKYFGWIVPTQINGKNSYGGYVGNQQYYFFFANGRVGDVTSSMAMQMVKFVD